MHEPLNDHHRSLGQSRRRCSCAAGVDADASPAVSGSCTVSPSAGRDSFARSAASTSIPSASGTPSLLPVPTPSHPPRRLVKLRRDDRRSLDSLCCEADLVDSGTASANGCWDGGRSNSPNNSLVLSGSIATSPSSATCCCALNARRLSTLGSLRATSSPRTDRIASRLRRRSSRSGSEVVSGTRGGERSGGVGGFDVLMSCCAVVSCCGGAEGSCKYGILEWRLKAYLDLGN